MSGDKYTTHLTSLPTMDSKGVAIVTGAARGIGRGVALRLAADGFDLALNDLASSKDLLEELRKEITALGRHSIAFTADVTVEAEVQDLVETTVAELGGLDVVCSIPTSTYLLLFTPSNY